MTCTLTFRCDYCQIEVAQEPLAGRHPELRVWVRYPPGWGFDSDGDAMCPDCARSYGDEVPA